MPFRPIFAVLFLFILFCGCGPRPEEEPTWIGCVSTFSGADQLAGLHLKQGIALAVDDSTALRVENHRLAIVAADDRASDEATQAEAVRLLSVNHVAALIGGADAGRSLRVARAAQAYPAPVVLPCEIAGPLPGDAVFTLGVRPGWRGLVLARYATEELKAKRALVLTDVRDPIAVELASAFVMAWPHDGGASVEQTTFQSNAELQDGMAHAATARPDVLVIAAPAAEFLKARAQGDAGDLHAPLLYGGGDVGAEPFAAVGQDVYTATVFTPGELTERGQEFGRKYQERFHEAVDLPAVQGYDAARLLFDAMTRAKTAAGDRVRERLAATTDFESLTGSLKIKEGRTRRRVFVVALRDGTAKVMQKIDPEPEEPPVAP